LTLTKNVITHLEKILWVSDTSFEVKHMH